VVRKFFPHDKNYLLEGAQLRVRDRLLTILIDQAIATYQREHNPLGLNDAFSERIANYFPKSLAPLYPFYDILAGVYRFKFGDNQLTFLWDGRDHSEQYEEEWISAFVEWTNTLCQGPQFAQGVLDLTVFLPENGQPHLKSARLEAVLLGRFELKIHKQKGFVPMRVA
jgi:hypothetical protein